MREWLTEGNTTRPSRATGVPPATRIAEERARLRPLKVVPSELALRIPVSVSATGVVVHDGHPYSMPPDAIGLPGTLYLLARSRPDHRRALQCRPCPQIPAWGKLDPPRASRRTRGGRLRQTRAPVPAAAALAGARDAGPRYLTELTHRRPRTWIHEVERLHTLLQTHGDAALRAAFERGVAEQAIGAEYIAHYLGTPMPPLPFDEPEDRPPTITAGLLPRGGRVQAAGGARRAGAQRRAWTRLSTAASPHRGGGRS